MYGSNSKYLVPQTRVRSYVGVELYFYINVPPEAGREKQKQTKNETLKKVSLICLSLLFFIVRRIGEKTRSRNC